MGITGAPAYDWYHTIELAPCEVTRGLLDLRPVVRHYGLPESMDGMRALDVGTYDGFWAFEMERRGAEVVAIDVDSDEEIDWPAFRPCESSEKQARGATFEHAKAALGSNVERHNLSVYNATPEELGTFDVVFCGSVIIHLRDQVLALERIAGLCTDRFISAEPFTRWLNLLPVPVARFRALDKTGAVVFWEPNIRSWRAMLQSAGFRSVDEGDRFDMRAHKGWEVRHVVLHAHK